MTRLLALSALLAACATPASDPADGEPTTGTADDDDDGDDDDDDDSDDSDADADTSGPGSDGDDAEDSAEGSDGESGGPCIPVCAGLECGPDPICGEPCGECGDGMCSEGQCLSEVVVDIDFDDLEGGAELDPEAYPNVTFETNPGNAFVIGAYASQATSPPNYIWGGSSLREYAELHLLFDTPVFDLSFKPVCINTDGTVGQVVVHLSDGTMQTQPLQSVHAYGTSCHDEDIVDLTALEGVTEVHVIEIDDTAGLGWDDIHYRFYE